VSRNAIGGSTQFILNNEIIFPIVPGIGLKGVVFVDAGNAYTAGHGLLARRDARRGRRRRALALTAGSAADRGRYPLVKKEHDHKSLILFSFGGPFQF
jgi:outer membrane protein assembly factor BamA